MIEYRFRVPSATVFTLYSYSKSLEYRLQYATTASLSRGKEQNKVHCVYVYAFADLLVRVLVPTQLREFPYFSCLTF
jgi:hypothetical protein